MPSFEYSKQEAEFRRTVSQIHNLWCDCGNYLKHLKPRGGWPTDTTADGDWHPDPIIEEGGITDEDLGTVPLEEDITDVGPTTETW